jgi:hypothetical protein
MASVLARVLVPRPGRTTKVALRQSKRCPSMTLWPRPSNAKYGAARLAVRLGPDAGRKSWISTRWSASAVRRLGLTYSIATSSKALAASRRRRAGEGVLRRSHL